MVHSRRAHRIAAAGGFTITELLVASALFLVVAIATYSAFHASNKVYGRGEQAAEMQQRTRLGFEQVMTDLRLAGFDHDRDGDENAYPNHPDEQVEFVGAHAITFRANLDAGDGNGGRETDLELPADDPNFGILCCPIVTTANDEIVTYALRSNTDAANTGSITLKVDTSAPRDAGWDEDGELVQEEEVVIEDVDLTDDNPPYTLMRFTLDADGAVAETPVATDLRSVSFTYASADGLAYYCSDPEDDGTCQSGNQTAFLNLGGGDDVATGDGKARTARAGLRRIDFEMVGMTELDDPQYADADDTFMPHRRKLTLTATIAPPNLGLRGRPDLEDEESFAPTNVTACGGQCGTIRIEWDEAERALSYKVNLYSGSQTEPFFSNVTPGVQIAGTDPPRVYAIYQRLDSNTIQEGASIIAKVQSRLSGDEYSEESEASAVATVEDLARLEAPQDLTGTGYDPSATGWPDLAANELLPDTTNDSGNGAEVNQITISWVPPSWALDVTDPDDPDTWTTLVNDRTHAALECDSEMADTDGDTVADKTRTRAREMFGDIRYFVFRSTNPRFVPTQADLIASIPGVMDTQTGRVSFTDTTVHIWRTGIFNGSTSAVETCKTYYYRVRAVDDCYSATDPSARDDEHLSPFQPPLNDAPDAQDSDDIDGISDDGIGLAIPGYAIPQAMPKAPAGVRFSNVDRTTSDGDGIDATICFDAVKLDSHEILDAQGTAVPDYGDIVIGEYRVYSHATKENFNLSDALAQTDGVVLEKTIPVADLGAGRIAYDDENGDGTITRGEDESKAPGTMPTGAAPNTSLRITSTGSPRYYRVLAMQCIDERTIPSEADSDDFDFGPLSKAVKFPCEFGGGPYSVIVCNASNFPTSVTATAFVENVNQPAKKARLVLIDPATGNRAITADNSHTVNTLGVVTFNAADIAALTDNFGNGNYLISVEMTDQVGCIGVSNSDDQQATLPGCCLTKYTPFVQWKTGDWLDVKVTESCGAASLRILKITVDIDNDNKGQPERFTKLLWGTQLLWTGSKTNVEIDVSANPLILSSGQTGLLSCLMSRNPKGDNMTVTYEYRIGGQLGTCTFVQTNIQ